MATLTDDVKAFIVQALACFDTPHQVSDAVKEQFGLTVSRQQCEAYDPSKKIGAALSKKWRELFEETRKQFLAETGSIPIENQAYRLRVLNRLLVKAEKQAAKEAGGTFTNKHRLEHSGEVKTPELRLVLNGTLPTRAPDGGVSN